MRILGRINSAYQRETFNRRIRDILRTPSLAPGGEEPTIVSMVCHRDVLMYVLAVKSFYRKLNRGRIVIIDDGTLTRRDIDLLRFQVAPSEFVRADSLVSASCPSYISWKKLFCIAHCIRDSFTIQLDSDTLTVGDIADIGECIDAGASFILGTWKDQEIASMAEANRAARESPSRHVQMMAERNFDKLPNFRSLKYVRGCSGFDGFSRNLFGLADLEELSRQMFRLIGDKWNEWGSEQTASNIIIANAERARVLPYPKYYSYWGVFEDGAFIHFVGTHRYAGGVYAREAGKLIEAMLAEA
jgi:hypothetical protein